MPKQITYSWHPGAFRSNFNAKRIGDYLNFLGRYWDIQFSIAPAGQSGRIRFILANINSGWAAVTNGFDCRISATKNWADAGDVYLDMICAKVTMHEFGHMVRQGNIHSRTPGLMDTNASMPTGNLVQSDYPWFDAYPKKGKRPHEEPNAMRRAFIPNFVGAMPNSEIELGSALHFGCGHEPVKRPWYDIRPKSLLVP